MKFLPRAAGFGISFYGKKSIRNRIPPRSSPDHVIDRPGRKNGRGNDQGGNVATFPGRFGWKWMEVICNS